MSPVPPFDPNRVPPRPDHSEPSRAPLVAAFVITCLLAVVLGGLAIASVLRGSSSSPVAAAPAPTSSPSPTTSGTSSPSPSTSLPPRTRVDGAFKFLSRVAGNPVRWDPCQSISYAVNAAGASSPVHGDLREALRRVTRATGIEFEPAGTTEETFLRAYQRMRYASVIRRAELLVIWVDHEDYEQILRSLRDPRPSIAFAKTMAGLYADRDEYFGGIIVMDADATAGRGFGYRYAHGSVLLHELGHIMGLDHVEDPDQLMYAGRHPNFGLRDYGAGDLEGLRRVGMDAGCLD